MSGKIKIIFAVLSVLSVLLLCSCGKSTDEENVSTEIWQTTPEIFDFATETEPTYSSYEEPFSNSYYNISYKLSEQGLELNGAYFRTKGNSLAIESFIDADGKYEFFVCKFKDGKATDLTLKTEAKKLTKNNNILIDKDSDMLVLRYYTDKETIRQIIYDYDDGQFVAVRDKNFGYDDTGSMEEAVTEYKQGAKNLLLFSECAETKDITGYIEKNLNIGN